MLAQLKQINPDGEYHYLRYDVSLLKNACHPIDETGGCQTLFATSAGFPPAAGSDANVVALNNSVAVAVGANGKIKGDVYSIDWEAEGTNPRMQKLINDYEEDGTAEKLWQHTQGVLCMRITGSETL
ncbi:hypothetical protein F5Y08DRAFT_343274 [Xylaria arbuscula]|nr:hypothetical protein F5Y08DRAFT_343274 [Xylaria arbuscula]